MPDLSIKKCLFCQGELIDEENNKEYWIHYRCSQCVFNHQLKDVFNTWNTVMNKMSFVHIYIYYVDVHISHQFATNITIVRKRHRDIICEFVGFTFTPSNTKEKIKTMLTFQ